MINKTSLDLDMLGIWMAASHREKPKEIEFGLLADLDVTHACTHWMELVHANLDVCIGFIRLLSS